jgi:hypothetical protein
MIKQNNSGMVNYDTDLSTATNIPIITIEEVLQQQSKPDGWICPDCIHHDGNLKCEKNMFISFVGCYTKDCQTFKEKI